MKALNLAALLLFSAPLFAQGALPYSADRYGGLIGSATTCANANTTGFDIETITGRMWFCTPNDTTGNKPMFSVGAYVMDCGAVTSTDNQQVIYPAPNNVADYKHRVQGKYGDCGPMWGEVSARQARSIGINTWSPYLNFHANPTSSDAIFPLDSQSVHGMLTKQSFVGFIRPFNYSSQMNFTGSIPYITEPVKSIMTGRASTFTGSKSCSGCGVSVSAFVPAAGVGDYFDGRILTWSNAELANTSFLSNLNITRTSKWSRYLMGYACEDSDQTYGLGAGSDYPTTPAGHNSAHLGWIVATGAPIITAATDHINQPEYYTDSKVYSKTELEAELKTTYSNTIASLNTAWGTSYTQFDSTATAVAAEAYATADGTAGPFTHTLAHLPDRCSVKLLVAGHQIAGFACGQGGTSGAVQGPNILSGSVNYGTGLMSVQFKTPVARAINANQNCTAGTCTVSTTLPHGAVPGDTVTVAGSSACNGAFTVATAPNQLQFTYACASTVSNNTSSAVTYQVSLPLAADAITVAYNWGGYCNGGTGMMDECGTGFPIGNPCTNYIDLSDCSTNVKGDLNGFLQKYAYQVFDTCHQAVRTFGASLLAPNAHLLVFGPDTLGTWSDVPRAQVLLATTQNAGDGTHELDAAILGGSPGITQSMLDFIHTSAGDLGLINGEYRTANLSSEFRYKVATATRTSSVATLVTDHVTPQGFISTGNQIQVLSCLDTTFNTGLISPVSSNGSTTITYNNAGANAATTGCVVIYGNDTLFATQTARTLDYYNSLVALYNLKYTADNVHPLLGSWWWQWTDNWGEKLDWGLKTGLDNWIDGVQNTSTPGIDPQCQQCLLNKTCTNDAGNAWTPTTIADCKTGGEFYSDDNGLSNYKLAAAYWTTTAPVITTTLKVQAPSSVKKRRIFTVSVTAVDGSGNILPGYTGTVHFTSTCANGRLPSDSTLSNGAKMFSVAFPTSETCTVTATDTVNSSITGTTASITVTN